MKKGERNLALFFIRQNQACLIPEELSLLIQYFLGKCLLLILDLLLFAFLAR